MQAMSGPKGLPTGRGIEKLQVKALHAEHAIIDISESAVGVDVGDKLETWV